MKKDNRARSFVTIMLVIAVFALVLRVSIERIIKINIVQNESYASATLKLISTALENYAKEHLGVFPASLSVLSKDNPPYLDKDYISESAIKGYTYSCVRLEASGYSCSANPLKCNLTGKMIYNVATGGLLTSEECSKKE